MRRLVWLLLMCCVAGATAFGRLGDTLDQAEARYGLEKQPKGPKVTSTLLEGSREVLFEFEGWRIRCALLQATDGNFYVVREEYTKIWNSEVARKGGSQQILDSDRSAIFQAEGGNWSSKTMAEIGPDVIPALANQPFRPFGDLKVWLRNDGALARMTGAPSVVLDLFQARKYEAELGEIKRQQQKVQP